MGGPTRLKLVAQSHPTARVYLLSGTGCAWALVRRRVSSEITLAVGIPETSNANVLATWVIEVLFPSPIAPKKFERGTRVPLALETFYQEQS